MTSAFFKVVGQSTMVRLASAAVLLTLSILLARGMGPEGFGAYTFVYALISLAVLLVQLGFPDLTVREVASLAELGRRGQLRRYLLHANRTIGLLGLFVGVAVTLAMLTAREAVPHWSLVIAGMPLVVLMPIMAQLAAVLRGAGLVVQSLLAQQLYRPALLALMIAGGWLAGYTLSPIAVMLLHGVASALVLVELYLRVSRVAPTPDGRRVQVAPARLRAWTAAALLFSGVAVVRLINTKFDTIAIGLLMTDSDVGLYAVGAQLSQVAAAMLLITAGIVQPAIARASASGDDAEVERQCRYSALLSLAAALVTLVLAAVFGEWVIATVFGSEYTSVWPAMMVLMSGQAVSSLFGPVGVLCNMRGEERSTFLVTLAASLCNIGLNLVLIPRFGIVGAALSTVAAMVIWNMALWSRAWLLWGVNSSAVPYPRGACSPTQTGSSRA